jgi:hypothetical protein
MCDHAKRLLGRFQHKFTTQNKQITELNAKLDIEAIRYEMQVKQSKTNIQLLAISWVFFSFFVAVFWGNYYVVCNGHLHYKQLPWKKWFM